MCEQRAAFERANEIRTKLLRASAAAETHVKNANWCLQKHCTDKGVVCIRRFKLASPASVTRGQSALCIIIETHSGKYITLVCIMCLMCVVR